MRAAAVILGVLAVGSPATAKGPNGCKWQPPHRDRVAKLNAPTDVAARIARADVAHLGTRALSALSGALADKRITSDQARAVVNAMLVESVPLARMKSYRPLLKLIDTRTARAIAAPLFAAEVYDSGAVGLLPRGAQRPKRNAVRQAILDLTGRGADAVLIAHELLRERRPARRLFGAEVLVRLGAVGQRATLERLSAKDRGRVDFSSGCVVEQTTVGAVTARWLKHCAPFKAQPNGAGGVCRDAERYLRWVFPEQTQVQRAQLVNELRRGGTWSATDFADYWRRATPFLLRALNPRERPCRCRKHGQKRR